MVLGLEGSRLIKGRVSILVVWYLSLFIAVFIKPLHDGHGDSSRIGPTTQRESRATAERSCWGSCNSGIFRARITTDCRPGTAGLMYVWIGMCPNLPITSADGGLTVRFIGGVWITPGGVTHAMPPMLWNVLWPVTVPTLKSALSNTNCVKPPRA